VALLDRWRVPGKMTTTAATSVARRGSARVICGPRTTAIASAAAGSMSVRRQLDDVQSPPALIAHAPQTREVVGERSEVLVAAVGLDGGHHSARIDEARHVAFAEPAQEEALTVMLARQCRQGLRQRMLAAQLHVAAGAEENGRSSSIRSESGRNRVARAGRSTDFDLLAVVAGSDGAD
jgi:hypothetical protein